MKFSELAKVIFDLPESETVMLLGKPGIGKTACGRHIAQLMTEAKRKTKPDAKPASCHVVDLSSSLPEDVSGLPFRQGDVTEYCPTAWVHDLCQPDAYGVLILDDLPAATQAVQVAVRQIALERRVHRHVFAPGVRVVVTGNRREDKSAAATLPAHFRNSCVMLQVEPDLEEWCTYAASVGTPNVIAAFLRFRPAHLAKLPKDADEQGAFATPRTWIKLGRCFNSSQGNGALLDVSSGLVGAGVAAEFGGFVRTYTKMPDIQALLEDPVRALPTPPSQPDELVAITTAIGEYTGKACKDAKSTPKTQDAAVVKMLRALAHTTRTNREYCAAGISTFTNNGGTDIMLQRGGAAAARDPLVAELLTFLAKSLRTRGK